jgi:hypothetical protein
MKFINKLFSSDPVCWKNWLLSNSSSFDTPSHDPPSYLWRIVNDELNTYRSITSVQIKNGAATSFWFDHWLPVGPLYNTHPALFSHTTHPNVSVQHVFENDFDLRLRPRLTNAASQELGSLITCLQGMQLEEGHDVRLMKTTKRPYTTRDAYAALDLAGESSDIHGR